MATTDGNVPVRLLLGFLLLLALLWLLSPHSANDPHRPIETAVSFLRR